MESVVPRKRTTLARGWHLIWQAGRAQLPERRPNDDPDKPGDTPPYSQEMQLHVSETTPHQRTAREVLGGESPGQPAYAPKPLQAGRPSQTRSAPPLIDYTYTCRYMQLTIQHCVLPLPLEKS